MRFVKVYGAQRSGTNWIRYLLETNFHDVSVVDLPLGDKHATPAPRAALDDFLAGRAEIVPFTPSELPYDVALLDRALTDGRVRAVAMCKDLLPWVESYHRYQLLRTRGQAPLDEQAVRSYVALWLERNTAYLDALPRHFERWVVLRYANLVDDLQTALHEAANVLELTPTSDRYRTSPQQMTRGGDLVPSAALETPVAFDAERAARAAEELPTWAIHLVRELADAGDVPLALRPMVP